MVKGQPEASYRVKIPSSEPACPDCYDMGFVVPSNLAPGDGGFGRAVPCHCAEAVGKQRLLQNSGLRTVEHGWTLHFYEGLSGKTAAQQAAMALLRGAPRPTGWVSLYGEYGTGKSGILKALTAQLIQAGVGAVYRRAEDILSEARSTFSDNAPAGDTSERAVRRRYEGCPFLAVDEIDRIPATPWAQAFIFSLMDERYNRRAEVATGIASNRLPGQMGGRWAYLESRMSDGQRIIMAGDSLRGAAGGS